MSVLSKRGKCKDSQIGRIVIHKDDEEKRVYSNELSFYLDSGWSKGYSDIHKKSLSKSFEKLDRKSICKGKKLSNETKEKISNSLAGNVPWNKGLTKETDERVSKISSSKMGHLVSNETKEKLKKANTGKKVDKQRLEIKLTKEYITKKKNNSFNTSKKEEMFYESLLEENKTKTIFRQYKDDRYPFYCDFYIKEDDLFIELNLHWTHGGKLFNENDEECLKQLSVWKEKAKTSKFYENAIQTWTVRDVNKQKIAKENKLNYKVIY